MFDYNEMADLLKTTTATVVFTKNNGDTRSMKCTLQEDLIPATITSSTKKTKTPNTEALSVWDLEIEGWRSFRIDSIVSVNPS